MHSASLGFLRSGQPSIAYSGFSGSDALEAQDIIVLAAEIPLRAEFQNALTEGRPLLLRNPDHIGSSALRQAAGELFAATEARRAA